MQKMLTMPETAAETGVSYYTIRRWCITGEFKGFVKAGRKTLINFDRFLEFLNGGAENGRMDQAT